MIRPELREAIWRWREVLATLALTAVLAWLAFQMFPPLSYILALVAVVSAGFVYSAVQRLRFASKGEGLGMVEVDEGVISYLVGGGMGGQVSVPDLRSVTLIPKGAGEATWRLEADGQAPLNVPANAYNAEALFDAFVTLEGLETERMLRQIKQTPDHPVVIWRKRTTALH